MPRAWLFCLQPLLYKLACAGRSIQMMSKHTQIVLAPYINKFEEIGKEHVEFIHSYGSEVGHKNTCKF